LPWGVGLSFIQDTILDDKIFFVPGEILVTKQSNGVLNGVHWQRYAQLIRCFSRDSAQATHFRQTALDIANFTEAGNGVGRATSHLSCFARFSASFLWR